MKYYDYIIIGFGKAGKTIAKDIASRNYKVAMIEAKKEMYGGTCINVGCIPSKTIVHDGLEHVEFNKAIERKSQVVSKLNQKNFKNLDDDANIDVYTYHAQFKENKVIVLMDGDQEIDTLTAEKIIINTGAKPVIPKIEGLQSSQRIYDSTGIMNLAQQPDKLVIIGGGYIALEFAAMFSNFGTKVTVIERNDDIMPKEDREIVSEVKKAFETKGVEFVLGANVQSVEDKNDITIVRTENKTFEADAVLVAIGRTPNTNLGLDKTEIKLGQRGEIVVNDKLETDVNGVYAVGDVKGGMQFTYISLDDYRILKDQFFGEGKRTTENRGAVPYTVFIDPPLSRVGMTLEEASKQYNAVENKVMVNQMPRHLINNDARGMFKVVVDADSHHVLGATLFGLQSEELINLIKFAVDQGTKYETLRDAIYTHPTMTESFNDLFNIK